MNGVLNLDTNQGDSNWGYSAYNPLYSAWGGVKILASDYSQVQNDGNTNGNFWGCSTNQYIYLALADYNQGNYALQKEVTNCVLNSGTGGYNYVNKILNTDTATGGPYSTLCSHISGCTDPYTGFPNS